MFISICFTILATTGETYSLRTNLKMKHYFLTMEASKFWKQGTSLLCWNTFCLLSIVLGFMMCQNDWLDDKAFLTMTSIPSWRASVEYLRMFQVLKFSLLLGFSEYEWYGRTLMERLCQKLYGNHCSAVRPCSVGLDQSVLTREQERVSAKSTMYSTTVAWTVVELVENKKR